MTIFTSLHLALRFMFPLSLKLHFQIIFCQKSPAKKCFAAMICVSLSLVFIAVMVFRQYDKGMTERVLNFQLFIYNQFNIKHNNTTENINQLKNLANKIDEVDGVEGTFIERTGMALAAGKKERSGATIRAVETTLFDENESFRNLFEVKDGVLAFESEKSTIIGSALAEKTGLAVGDTLRLITMRTLPNGKTVPKTASFTVCGIISSGYQELDALWVFVPLESGFEFLSSNVSRMLIGIKTNDAFSKNLYEIQEQCQEIADSGFGVYNWKELNYSTYETFNTTKMMLLFIMFLIVLVASVNVSSALIMLTMEKRKEIAILKAIGASPSKLQLAFVMTGFLTGLGGVI